MNKQELAEYFQYLDNLRESGIVNMFGAGPYLKEKFDLDRKIARKVLTARMSTFDGESSATERAEKAEI